MRYCCRKSSPVSKEGYGWFCENCGTLLDELGREPRFKPEPLIKPEVIKIGRNEPCRCESGKKFKNCCGQLINKLKAERRQALFERARKAITS